MYGRNNVYLFPCDKLIYVFFIARRSAALALIAILLLKRKRIASGAARRVVLVLHLSTLRIKKANWAIYDTIQTLYRLA